jgi:hypothetical protein
MELDADAFHDQEDGYYLDCPNCGSMVSVDRIIELGYCDGRLEADEVEVEGGDETPIGPECGAALSLELVWGA